MTLLQTRVDDRTARRFEQAAKQHGQSPYSYLQALVKSAAAKPEPRGWETHAADLAKLGTRRVNRSVVADDRAAEDAR
jgi:hypothetical protein